MRVISGKFKGKRLFSPIGNDVRPTSDMVKESIFAMIQFDIAGAVFVDLFAGSGAMGIEAVSRGAREVIFCDSSRKSVELIKKNVAFVGFDDEDAYSIIEGDHRSALKKLKGKRADFIFLDPPYKDKPLEEILSLCESESVIAEDGLVIYEHLYSDKIAVANSGFEIKKSKKYGSIGVEVIGRK